MQGGGGHTLEERDPRAERLLEVELAAHRPLGDLRDLGLAAGVRGDHLDDLALDQRGVDVHHDEPHAAAQQVGGLDRDVDALPGGLGGQLRAQRVGSRARDVQVQRGDRVARHPLDAVDVGAGIGDATGHRGHRGSGERGAEHGDVRASVRGLAGVAAPRLHLQGHRQLVRGRLEVLAQALDVVGGRHQQAEDEATPQHDLLQVHDLDPRPAQGREDRRGDAGALAAGQRDQQGVGSVGPVRGAVRGAHRGTRLSVAAPALTRAARPRASRRPPGRDAPPIPAGGWPAHGG